MAETSRQAFEDDSSTALGLDHSTAGEVRYDGQGRRIAHLPAAANEKGYDAELVGKNPEQIAEILATREGHEVCEDPNCQRCNTIDDKLISEAPGSTASRHGSSSGRKIKRPPPPAPDRTKQSTIDAELSDRRPCTVSGKISVEANRALCDGDVPNVGEMVDYVGRAIARGVTWTQISNAIQVLTLAQ